MFLSTINPDMVPKQGTVIGAAISLGIRSFSPGEDKSKAIIIITDGENHEDNPIPKAEEASENGIVIHTIGIGSSEGVPVPVKINGRRDYLKDVDGNTVITKLDEDILKKIALTTGGNYVRASNSNIGLDEIFREIKKMKKQELERTAAISVMISFLKLTLVPKFPEPLTSINSITVSSLSSSNILT